MAMRTIRMEEEMIKLGDCKTEKEACALIDQYLNLLKAYDKKEYEDLIENGVVCIEVRPTNLSPQ